MDPSSTDFRAFFPYTPNEVKHRKRTTGAQLKVLENIFKHDTKPNASLRKELASQLDMTARGVQVWFQNRRAKEKNKANRAGGKPSPDANHPESDHFNKDALDEVSDSASPDLSKGSPLSAIETGDSISQTPSPSVPVRSFYPINTAATDSSANTSWQNSPVEPPPPLSSYHLRSGNDISDIQIASYRRGSLPVNALSPSSTSSHPAHGPPQIDQLDPLARRRSVDASLQRLAHNPFASVARARNAQLYGSSRVVAHGHHHPAVWYGPSTRPLVHHRSTLPAEMELRRSVSFCAPSPLSSGGSRLSVPNHYVPQRVISSQPLPGPLPSPDFSFGAPYASSSPPLASPALDQDRGSPESFQYGYRSDELETEDDAAYDALSRFGSITSVVSESSTFYSEGLGPLEEGTEAKLMRRDSCAPAFLELMENLDVAQPLPPHAHSYQDGANVPDNCVPSADAPTGTQEDTDGSLSFPSPGSTVSPGGSPPLQSTSPSNVSVNISRSSELAFALQETKSETPTPSASGPMENQARLVNAAAPPSESDESMPPHQAYNFHGGPSYSASSSPNLPLTYPFRDVDYPSISTSPPEQYHNLAMYGHGAPEDMSAPHASSMEYVQCGSGNEASGGLGAFGMYGATNGVVATVPPSSTESADSAYAAYV
ncbi:hypothetical protein ONZ45_g945 [Pleurotus djamor]|nr:hypothetical protein ONZ45_g945 [Pleurotus djamor]